MPDEGISAVITTFNRAPIVQDAIRSVLEQTRTPAELIVVDDGSSDDTENSVRKGFAAAAFPCRYIRQENGGMAAALNRGIAEATGAWIAFLDDDDLWAPDHLQRCETILRRHPELECVCGLRNEGGKLQVPPAELMQDFETLDRDGPVLTKRRAPLMRPFFTPVVGTTLIKKTWFSVIRFEPEVRARLDLHFFWRLSQHTDIAIDQQSHGTARQFRTSYISTDAEAPQSLKNEIALRSNSDSAAMLRTLLRDTSLPPGHVFRDLYRRTLIGRPYLLRAMGRHREALKALRPCIGECAWGIILKEALFALAHIPSRKS